MNQRGLRRRERHAVGVVAQQPEVRILVDAHGDQAGDIGDLLVPVGLGLVGPDLGVGGGEGGDALDGGEEDAADVGTFIETKRTTNLVESNQLSELPGVHEEMVRNVLQIAIDEGLLNVEAEGNNVAGIFHSVVHGLLEADAVLEQGLLVIRQHENQRHVKHILQPFRKLQRDGVSQVQTAGAGPAAGVEEEGLAVLVARQDLVEIAVAEEQASSQPAVRLVSGDPFETFQELVVDGGGVPFSRVARLAVDAIFLSLCLCLDAETPVH